MSPHPNCTETPCAKAVRLSNLGNIFLNSSLEFSVKSPGFARTWLCHSAIIRCPLNCDHRLFYLCSKREKFVYVADKRMIRQEVKLFVPGAL